ncbi:site-specific DNA-methyltransferase [Robinsoniella peoriensis]|uniref:site-specific DNA-methyltransferase n=1 Tax=Robinsoniella peoriensis TaxID=180332 RepID=UPI0036414738
MANLSQQKRQRMLDFLETIKSNNPNEDTRIAINEIENELTEKKYGLVWEKHEENVDVQMRSNVPVFTEVKDKEILGVSDSNDFNFLLEGDNLHSLKLLEKTHKGKVDVIYIDPPYNRGKNDFRYDDAFVDPEDGFKHSKWLSFMSERLSIARNLLSKDGAIFISIDDNEQTPLKLLCDEVFGSDNFLGIIIQNKQNSKNDTINIQKNHEYIISYRKQCNFITNTKIKPTLINSMVVQKKIFVENDEYYYLNDAITTRGEGGTLAKRKNLGYTVYFNPQTNEKLGVRDYDIEKALISDDEDDVYTTRQDLVDKGFIPVRPPRVRGHLGCWTWDMNKFNSEEHSIVVLKSSRGNNYIVKKRTFVNKNDVYEEDGKLFFDSYSDANTRSMIDFSTNDGTTELSNILGVSGEFDNPKNVEMIKYLIRLVPNRNALVLDFFAGSGTTGQAVLELNNQDRGRRRFILCTNNQNNICEDVTYVRVKNRIEGYCFEGKKTQVICSEKFNYDDLQDMSEILDCQHLFRQLF